MTKLIFIFHGKPHLTKAGEKLQYFEFVHTYNNKIAGIQRIIRYF